MIASSTDLYRNHLMLGLRDGDVSVLGGPIPDTLARQIEANRPALAARLRSEREVWRQHYADCVAELDDLLDRFIETQPDEDPEFHNAFVAKLNWAWYVDEIILRERYGLEGCALPKGGCPESSVVSCDACAKASRPDVT